MSVLIGIALVTSSATPSALSQTQRRDQQRAAAETSAAEQSAGEREETLKDPQRPIPVGLDEPVDPDTYVIGPYDEFVLILHGQAQRTIHLTVLPEGVLVLPNLGAFPAAGLTITEFRNKLRSSLKRYYKNVEFDFQLVTPRTFVVYVTGEVNNPGGVVVYAPFRVGAAIVAAGSMTDNGSLRYVEIRQDGETVRTVDLFSFLRLGSTKENPALKEGQSVYVPARQANAHISGEVWNGGRYEIRPGETLADLIRFAGGAKSYAAVDLLILERHEPNGRVAVGRYNLAEADTAELQDRDIVVVPDRRAMEDNSYVMLRGGGGREGKVYIEEGETIASFIPRFVRLREDHDINRAVIEREKEDGSIEYIGVDLEKVISGEDEGAIPLQDGDIISIPEVDDFVYVSGEVTNPGKVEFQRGLPAERYIALAGGPTRAGSINKVRIYSKDGTIRDGNRESMVYRGDTILVGRRLMSYVGPAFVAFTSLTSLILSVIAVSK